jgi:hypothetical protein
MTKLHQKRDAENVYSYIKRRDGSINPKLGWWNLPIGSFNMVYNTYIKYTKLRITILGYAGLAEDNNVAVSQSKMGIILSYYTSEDVSRVASKRCITVVYYSILLKSQNVRN